MLHCNIVILPDFHIEDIVRFVQITWPPPGLWLALTRDPILENYIFIVAAHSSTISTWPFSSHLHVSMFGLESGVFCLGFVLILWWWIRVGFIPREKLWAESFFLIGHLDWVFQRFGEGAVPTTIRFIGTGVRLISASFLLNRCFLSNFFFQIFFLQMTSLDRARWGVPWESRLLCCWRWDAEQSHHYNHHYCHIIHIYHIVSSWYDQHCLHWPICDLLTRQDSGLRFGSSTVETARRSVSILDRGILLSIFMMVGFPIYCQW